LQNNLKSYDSAQWIRKARIYELFPRAYNTQGRRNSGGFNSTSDPNKTLFFRDFQASDFDVIKRMGFDTIWPMGILPIGVRGQTGTGGGSPYSISDHSTVHPDLGTEEDFRNFVQKAHQAGLRVIVDFVVNHTSLDSKLLGENPDYFINYVPNNGQCSKDGYFDHHWNGKQYCIHHGGFEYGNGIANWIDTAQINYSNIYLRRRMIDIVRGWVTKFNVDGFRVDMAYLALNNVFSRTWKKPMPNEEFYNQLIKEVKSIKASAAFVAEAYAFQEDLSVCGFDAIYSKYESARPEGQTGWYEATANANNYEQQSAINRQAFLAWQQGGSGSVGFIGNHDEMAPEKVYGKRLPAALIMTMLLPSSVMVYSGAEIGYDASIPAEHKPLPFSAPCQINWNGGNPWVKQVYQNAFYTSQRIREELGDYEIEPIWPKDGGGWTGYIMKSRTNPQVKKAVIGNLTWNNTYVREFNLNTNLEPGEYRIIDLP
jgi:glycosidase